MPPRTILYTGKGGVGKTSVAACTARRLAADGLRTLVLSTDPAHSLSESLQTDLDGTVREVAPRLWGQEVNAQQELERHWSASAHWISDLLAQRGVDPIAAAELTVPPGMDELFSLLQLTRHSEVGEFDAIVVDCAPTSETLRLLSFPELARWWLDRVVPRERQLMATARPLLRTLLDIGLPDEAVMAEVERLVRNLIAMREMLADHRYVTIRLVMTPDRMVVGEAMRTFTYLNLYGYLTDAVIVNRIFPDAVAGTYFGPWRELQQQQLELVGEAFAPVPVLRAPFFDAEVIGPAMLDRLAAELFPSGDPAAVLHDRLAHELTMSDGEATLRIDLPFAGREDVGLEKIGAELIVRVDGRKRMIALPPSLAGFRTTGAKLADGSLRVSFARADKRLPAEEPAL